MAALGRLTRKRMAAFLSSFAAFTIVLSGVVYLAPSAPSSQTEAGKTHVTLEVPPNAIKVAVDARIDSEGLPDSPPIPVALVPAAPRSLTRIVVLEGDPDAKNTTFTVLFRPLSPFTNGAAGVTIQPATADWLEHFGEALPACGVNRVKVTGHASIRGFGSPEHRNIWDKVVDSGSDEERQMNCGLANIRALQVAARLRSDPDVDDRVQEAVKAFNEARKLSRVATTDPPDLKPPAAGISELLIDSCASSNTVDQSVIGLSTEVHAWDDNPDNDWSWLPNAKTGVLDRSAHITLQGIGHLDKCPGLLRGHLLPLRVDDSP